MKKLLNNMKITTKLYTAFGVILLMLTILSAQSLTKVSELSGVFTKYRSAARQSLIANDLSKEFLIARMAVLKYRSGKEDGVKEIVDEHMQKIDELTNGIDQLVDNEENLNLLKGILGYSKEYNKNFNEAINIQAKRHKLVAKLDAIGPKMRKYITDVRESAYDAGDVTASNYAGAAQESLMLSRLYAGKFLLTNDPETYKRAQVEFKKSEERLDKLLSELENPNRRKLTIQAKKSISEYKRIFSEVFDIINKRNSHYKILDTIGPKAAADALLVVNNVKNTQNTLGPQASSLFETIKKTTVILSIICLIIGLVASFFIGRMISSSIRMVTSDTQELAKGNLDLNIHGTDRGDEIGDIAKALQVFKENMIETKRLEAEQAKATDMDMKRAVKRDEITEEFQGNIQSLLSSVSEAMHLMSEANGVVAKSVDQTNEQATAIAAATEEASANVQTVASATTEMSTSINEISMNIQKSLEAVNTTGNTVAQTDQVVKTMSETSEKIGDIVGMINDIAEQTNLLALNATIESARAGEAGKGFAVVANEVKGLAAQTTTSTEEISEQISTVQTISQQAVKAMGDIQNEMNTIEELITSVTAAIEEQNATTSEINRASEMAADGTKEVAQKVSQVAEISNDTRNQANVMAETVQKAEETVMSLQENIANFLKDINKV